LLLDILLPLLCQHVVMRDEKEKEGGKRGEIERRDREEKEEK
jgi:hypothetical protein